MTVKRAFSLFFAIFAILGLSSFNDELGIILNYVPPTSDNNYNGGPRTEVPPIYVEQDGHTLSFSTSYAGCLIKLMDDDNLVILTDYVNDNGVVDIPTDVRGVFTLLLYVDTHTAYSGEIELE